MGWGGGLYKNGVRKPLPTMMTLPLPGHVTKLNTLYLHCHKAFDHFP